MPPCCVDFCRDAPLYCAVGCYKLVEEPKSNENSEEPAAPPIEKDDDPKPPMDKPDFDERIFRKERSVHFYRLDECDDDHCERRGSFHSHSSSENATAPQREEQQGKPVNDSGKKPAIKDKSKQDESVNDKGKKPEQKEEGNLSERLSGLSVQDEPHTPKEDQEPSTPPPQKRIGVLYLLRLVNEKRHIWLYVPPMPQKIPLFTSVSQSY